MLKPARIRPVEAEAAPTPTVGAAPVRRKSPLLPLAILAVAAAAAGGIAMLKPTPAPVEVEERSWLVAVTTVAPESVVPQIALYGRVETPLETLLTAAVSAEVKELMAFEGQRVEEGQVLVTLDESDYALLLEEREAELAEVEAQIRSENERHKTDLASLKHEEALLELTRRAVTRAGDLAKKSMGSQAGLDEARQAERRQALALEERRYSLREHDARIAQLEARRARAAALRDRALLDLRRTQIRAPFAGRVAETHVSPGDRVRVGDELVKLYDTDALEIRAQVPTRHVSAVRGALAEGRELWANARVADYTVRARLNRLAGEVRPGSGGLDGLFRVVTGAEGLTVGKTTELVVDLPSEAGVVSLPVDAIYGMNRIYLVEDGRMRGLDVERVGDRQGPNGESYVLVRNPALTPGSRVVATQLPNAIEGLKVRTNEGRGLEASLDPVRR